jgi:triosephosphate isomerase
MTTKKLLIGNWKMNLGNAKSAELADAIIGLATKNTKYDFWVTPSSIALQTVTNLTANTTVKVGAQNVAGDASGAHTGELSVSMLKEIGVTYALTGHSERRNVYGESNTLCANRTLGALAQGLTVVFCVGEKLAEREKNETLAVIEAQLAPLQAGWKAEYLSKIIIAYEPVWAIGTGKVATLEEITSTTKGIIASWKKMFNAECPPVLYGGSVDPTNAKSILAIDVVGGCLIGGASLSAEKMAAVAAS